MKSILRFLFLVFVFYSCKQKVETDVNYETTINELVNASLNADMLNSIELIGINCDYITDILIEIYENDQDIRNEGEGDIEEIDRKNLQKFVSLVENCGFPTKDDIVGYKSSGAVFLVLQHAPKEWMTYYYFKFKELVSSGVLDKSDLAYFQDRLLSYYKYPQIYGSQIVNGRLYPIDDFENVNQRRKSVGLGKIEKYIDRFGLKFEDEIKLFRKDTTIRNFKHKT